MKAAPRDGARHPVPLTTRLAIEIPKPKDWQAFQRNCVVLFRAELQDPNAQEYGRGGQKQGGIDILGRRLSAGAHFVGIQCRLIVKPLREATILADARDALALAAELRELIFATTAPNDKNATDAALAVERTLHAEGHDLAITVYGWEQLQLVIALHEVAYNAFHPAAVATTAPWLASPHLASGFAADVAAQLFEHLRSAGLPAPPRETGSQEASDEDPALHARIDLYRDLFKEERLPRQAEKGLLDLLVKEDLAAKPWARFRIETNLGAIAMELGCEAEAVPRFEAAYALRRDDATALANLALARTIQGRFGEAMEAARAALAGTSRADYAVAYLLQAAARSDWTGDPVTLIPSELSGSLQADFGLAEFLRRRDVPGWETRTLELARRHADAPDFVRSRAIAILSLAIASGETLFGGKGSVTADDLRQAADDMKGVAEHCLAIRLADRHDLIAYVNNAAVLLRLCERYAESEQLLLAARPQTGDDPQLRRLCAYVQSAQDRTADALATLAGDRDPENRLFRAELRAAEGEIAEALNDLLAVPEAELDERLRPIRWRLIGELALWRGADTLLADAVVALRACDAADITPRLLEIRGSRKRPEDAERVREELRALAAGVADDLAMQSRYRLADELRDAALPEAAAGLLEGHVDLSRPSPALTLCLQCLAEARRDDAFQQTLAQVPAAVSASAAVRWTTATHAWNRDDLPAALAGVDAILTEAPDYPAARLLKLEILIRQDRSTDVFAELDRPLEKLDWRRPADLFRIATLLGHFGYQERAAALAYRLFLRHRDQSRAWMTLSMLVLDEGRVEDGAPRTWVMTSVAPDAAVRLHYADDTEIFFVVEPDPSLRQYDPDSWEPSHSLVRAVTGLGVGAAFIAPDGREGKVAQVLHKYVARLHYVLEHHETRFPEIFGFRSVPVDFEQPGGLDALIAQLKAHHDWIEGEERQYLQSFMPLAVLAARLGIDTIEVSGGLASHAVPLKVAVGNAPERAAALDALQGNAARGCVLDLLSFWTCWRLGALPTVTATAGPIHLPQSVLDRLRARRDRLIDAAKHGHRTAGYLPDGRISATEAPAELFVGLRDEMERAIAWATAHATILPLTISEKFPTVLQEHLRARQTDAFDSLALAIQTGALLITDDLPTREVQRALTGRAGVWLHAVFGLAHAQGCIDAEAFVRWSAFLVDAGHNYLGVSGAMLAQAARLDGVAERLPGSLFMTLSRVIGGRTADPRSHAGVSFDCLRALWTDPEAEAYRQPVSGHLVRQLIHERPTDYAMLVRTLLAAAQSLPGLQAYLHEWMTGHFVAAAVLQQE